MNERRMKWARDIERVRRIYEIRQQCEEYTENLRRSDRVIEGEVPREVERMLFTDWDRVIQRVWDNFGESAYYEAVVRHRLFDDVRLENEYHVCAGADGTHRTVEPDGSVWEDTETYGYERHRYMCADHADDALWLIRQVNDVLDIASPQYYHWAYVKPVVRENWS